MAWQNIFFSHGSNHQKGVAIFINPLFEITLENSWEDEDGRILLINANFNTVKFALCNIYAPNNTALQKAFIENLTETLILKTDVSNLIRVGDWNVTLEAIDTKGGIQWKPRVDYLNEVYVNHCLWLSCGLDVVSINNR